MIYIADDIDAESIKEEVIKCIVEIIVKHHEYDSRGFDEEVVANIAYPLAEALTVNLFVRVLFHDDFYTKLYKGVV